MIFVILVLFESHFGEKSSYANLMKYCGLVVLQKSAKIVFGVSVSASIVCALFPDKVML